MIKDTELRLGNWVTAPTFELPFQVDMNALIRAIDLEPISITKEWLQKFGFKKSPNIPHINGEIKFDWWSIEINCPSDHDIHDWLNTLHFNSESKTCVFSTDNGNEIGITTPKYVHQLQNIYFALTGKELTSKNITDARI